MPLYTPVHPVKTQYTIDLTIPQAGSAGNIGKYSPPFGGLCTRPIWPRQPYVVARRLIGEHRTFDR